MLPNNSAGFLTAEQVARDHGGGEACGCGALTGERSPSVRAWVRGQAEGDAAVRAWLAVVESPDARRTLRRALEAVNYLVDVEPDAAEKPPWGDDELTNLVQEP